MPNRSKSRKTNSLPNPSEYQQLRERLAEVEETLRAIRAGEVDAVVVGGPAGEQVYTLQGAERPYRLLVEAISEGAGTLSPEGIVLYANRRLAEMMGFSLEKLIGSPFMVPGISWRSLKNLLQLAATAPQRIEVQMHPQRGSAIPIYLSFSRFQEDGMGQIAVVAGDLSELKTKEVELSNAVEALRRETLEREAAAKHLEVERQALRQLSARLLQVQDEERRRIARDLHDSTGQKIVGLSLNLSSLSNAMSALEPGKRQIFAECFKLCQELSSDIRTMSYLLHPPLIDESGLGTAIRWYVKGFKERSGIDVDLDIPNKVPRLPREFEISLYRVLQESLTNVLRHSRSSTAAVRARFEKNSFILEVADDGCGLLEKPGEATNGSLTDFGVGIRGMRERLRQLGGQLDIVSKPKGILVRATLPVPQSMAKSVDGSQSKQPSVRLAASSD